MALLVVFRWTVSLCLVISALVAPSLLWAEAPVVSGGVRQDVTVQDLPPLLPPGSVGGEVHYQESGTPVNGATVRIPKLGVQTQTDPMGRFRIDQLPDGQRMLVISVEKPGYLPENAIVAETSRPTRPFHIAIEKQGRSFMLDNDLHHLGDGKYSWFSAGAREFLLAPEGKQYRRTFQLPAPEPGSSQSVFRGQMPILRIGAVVGLDTQTAQAKGQSFLAVHSQPPEITVNGIRLRSFDSNGTDRDVPIPLGVLNQPGTNVIEITSGHHMASNGIDYDDFEWMNLMLLLPADSPYGAEQPPVTTSLP